MRDSLRDRTPASGDVDLGRGRRWLLRIAAIAAMATAVVALAFSLFLGLGRTQDDSMLPNLGPGAGFIVLRRATPNRGDVVVVEHEGQVFLRRVIALPGQSVRFDASDGMSPIIDDQPGQYQRRGTLQLYGRTMYVVRETIGRVSHDMVDDPQRRRRDVPATTTGDGYYLMPDLREHASLSPSVVPAEAIQGVVQWVWSRGALPKIEPMPAAPNT